MRTRKHLNAIPPILALLVAVLVAVPAVAQNDDAKLAYLEGYIERTDELVQWAFELVAETESGTARSVLRQADAMNRRAHDALARRRAAHAANLAQRARAAVWHAVKLAREAMGLQERLRVRAERFRELHRHLSERARDLNHEGALELLRKAETQARRAREQHLQGDLRMAWQMFERAEDLTAMAARLLVDTGDPERLEHEIERLQDHLDRARERLGDAPPPRRIRDLAEAEEVLVRARGHLARGEPGRALQMIGLARRLADRALNAGPPGPDPAEAARRQLERFDERLAVVDERVREADDERARRLVGQARDHRERAAADLDRGDAERALRQLRAAHDLLEQAERLVR